jgi:hypothetical protein
MLSPFQSSWFDRPNNIWWTAQIMKLHCTIFSSRSYFPSLAPKCFLPTLSSDTLIRYTSLNVRDKVSDSYEATGRILVLYILVLTGLDIRQNILSVPKYFNFTTFSKNSFATFRLCWSVLHSCNNTWIENTGLLSFLCVYQSLFSISKYEFLRVRKCLSITDSPIQNSEEHCIHKSADVSYSGNFRKGTFLENESSCLVL